VSTATEAAAIARWAEERSGKPGTSGLTTAEEYQIVAASERAGAGMTVTKLAAEFGRSEVEIGRVLAKWADTRPAAKRLLNAQALQLTERMIGDADPSVALEILERLQVVESRKGGADGFTVNIGIADSAVSLTLSPPPARDTGDSE
jgi:hypothetical protein